MIEWTLIKGKSSSRWEKNCSSCFPREPERAVRLASIQSAGIDSKLSAFIDGPSDKMLNWARLHHGHDVIYHEVQFNTGDQVLCIESGTAKHKLLAAVIDVTVGPGTGSSMSFTSSPLIQNKDLYTQDAVDRNLLKSVLVRQTGSPVSISSFSNLCHIAFG